MLDVVEARKEDWSFDPFVLLEKDGYFYGRGTGDALGQLSPRGSKPGRP
jgi:acetylornithine deacetylase/succinyl-diaminopimelate desuccinylase-like protein